MLTGKRILLGVSGGIAAYKSVDLASKLVKEKAEVRVIMTKNATELVAPLTFRTITGQPVSIETFNAESPIEHISLADWCEMAIIAPATANIIGKIASGIADDLLSTVMMAVTSPKVIVPAMNVNMWNNAIVQDNIKKIERFGYLVVPPDKGMLACGYEGTGRFPPPEAIVEFVKSYASHKKDLIGKRILLTVGACREYIDPMRYLSNLSSGKMGLSLAKAAYHRGAEVIIVHSEVREEVPYYIEDRHYTITSKEMHEKVLEKIAEADIVIMNAAVTDYKPVSSSIEKIKKTGEIINMSFNPTTDILNEIYKQKKESQLIVGFAAETNDLLGNARKKLRKCDVIVVNHIQTASQDDTEVSILKEDWVLEAIKGSKFEVAHKILDILVKKNDE